MNNIKTLNEIDSKRNSFQNSMHKSKKYTAKSTNHIDSFGK
jgi:hypothetical protein